MPAAKLSSALHLLAVAVLAWAPLAEAQAAQPEPLNRIQPMNTDAAVTTAFFYRQPVVLDRDQHKGLRLKQADASFARQNQAVPLLLGEFPEACLEYPIVFSKGGDGQWLALALTGLTANSNAFVDARGRWTARYVPASVRRYPFILAEGAGDQLSLAADLAAPHLVAEGGSGEAIFDDRGEATELARDIMALLADFQAQARWTHELLQQLEAAKLLTQQNLQVRLDDSRSAVVEGVWIVDEARLRELPDATVLAWFRGGELAALHAQMLSLRNLLPLLERSQPATTATTAPRAGGKTGKSDKQSVAGKSQTAL